MPSKLGYWDIRGLGQPVRYLLSYVGEEFEDVRYVAGDGPEFNKDCWFSVKYTLGVHFPNLPYYMDENVKISQTNVILKYLGNKYNMNGETLQEKAYCDLGLEVVMELRNAFIQYCYGTTPEKFKQLRGDYIKDAKAKISAFNDCLGNKPYFAGKKLTVCDFHMYEMLEHHRLFEATILDDFPKLRDYCKKFETLRGVKDLIKSGKVKATPINNKMAHFK